jgi:hypothetical protein
MRTELLTYLTAELTDSIKTSQELPWTEGNDALYLKNARRVYLDEPNTEQADLFPTLGSLTINARITTVRWYLSMDAKNRNADLDSAITILGSAKDITTITGVWQRQFDYTTTIENDRIIYEGEYRFTNLA